MLFVSSDLDGVCFALKSFVKSFDPNTKAVTGSKFAIDATFCTPLAVSIMHQISPLPSPIVYILKLYHITKCVDIAIESLVSILNSSIGRWVILFVDLF